MLKSKIIIIIGRILRVLDFFRRPSIEEEFTRESERKNGTYLDVRENLKHRIDTEITFYNKSSKEIRWSIN